MKAFSRLHGTALLTLGLLAFCSGAAAQELKEGSSEVVGFLGLNYVFTEAGFNIGGGYGYAIKPNMLIVGEIGYVGGLGGGVAFNGNLHYLIPIPSLPKFTPYALGGIGIDHLSNNGIFQGFTAAGVNIGGGARWQLGDNWGLRPEWKMLLGNHFGTSLTAGIYYQFGK